MASLRHIPNAKGNPWEVRWRDHRTGKQPRRRHATRELANRAFQKALRVEGLDPMTPPERTATVGELVEMEEQTSSRDDKETNPSYIRNHVPESILRRDARTIAIEDIEDILATAAGKLAEPSVKKLRGILHGVFKFGLERRYLERNPVKGARITVECQPSRRARKLVDGKVDPKEIPSPDDVWAIAAAMRRRFYALVLFLGFIGLRIGEAAGLDVEDWDPTTRILRVHRSGADTEETKGKGEYRDIFVDEYLADILDDHIASYCKPGGPLFPAIKGGRLSPYNFRDRRFYPAVDKALGQEALDEKNRRRIRPHDLRHTAATVMIMEGRGLNEISHQLGHESPAFTLKEYTGVFRRHDHQEALEKSRAISDHDAL